MVAAGEASEASITYVMQDRAKVRESCPRCCVFNGCEAAAPGPKQNVRKKGRT